jgi:hypothetical protein
MDLSKGGWAFPNFNSNSKAHFFPDPAILTPSLCGRWGHVGQPFQGDAFSSESKDDCKACRKKVNDYVRVERP